MALCLVVKFTTRAWLVGDGSLAALETQLLLAVERGRCTATGIDSTLGEIWELQKMISVIQKRLSFRPEF